MNLTLIGKGSLVESLWHAVNHGAGNLKNIPGLVRSVIETEAWRQRTFKGKTYEHARFIDFITTKPAAGCGWPPDKVEALIKDDPETLTLWREAVQEGARSDLVDNINEVKPSKGTSKAYTLSRLKREEPEQTLEFPCLPRVITLSLPSFSQKGT